MGCRVVLEAARLLPKRVAGVVLIDGSRAGSGDPDAAESARARRDRQANYAAFAENLFRQMFFKPSAEADAIVARAVRSSAAFGAELWPRMARWDAARWNARWPRCAGAILAIQSTTRGARPQALAAEAGRDQSVAGAAQVLRRAGSRSFPDTGHFTQLEAPQRVNRLIAEFCR